MELFTAPISGQKYTLEPIYCERSTNLDGQCFRKIGGQLDDGNHYYSGLFTDLTPVTVVPKDGGVWIEGVTAEKLSAYLCEGYRATDANEMYSDYSMRWNDGINAILAQLTPSATTESEGGEKTTCCCMFCFCNGETDLVNSDNNVCDSCIKGAHAPKPTPTVTIELTEFKQHIADMRSDAGIARRADKEELRAELDHFANAFESLLTPPRPEEPKGFGAVVEAHLETTTTQSSRRRFFHDGFCNWYQVGFAFREAPIFKWSDLINPVVLSEGQVG